MTNSQNSNFNLSVGQSYANMTNCNVGENASVILQYRQTNNYYNNSNQVPFLKDFLDKLKTIFKKDDWTKFDISNSKYLRQSIFHNNPSTHIERTCQISFLEQGQRTICNFIGLPKIGKTTLLIDTCKKLDKDSYDTYWFDIPSTQVETAEFIKEFFDLTISILLQQISTKVKIRNEIDILSSLTLNIMPKNYIFIFDNSDNLLSEFAKKINEFICSITNKEFGKFFSFIFISNKKIKPLINSINLEQKAILWTKEELKSLINQHNILTETSDDYFNLIKTFSGGHPLLALILAKKYNSKKSLLTYKLFNTVKFDEDDLSKNFKTFLFENLLQDNSERKIFILLSNLAYNWNYEIFELIAKDFDVVPRLVFEKQLNVIFEGDEVIGYQIPVVYKDVAKNNISDDDKKNLYVTVAKYYASPKNNTLNAFDMTIAAEYYLFAQEYTTAYTIASSVLSMIPYDLDIEIVKSLISRLEIFIYLEIDRLSFDKISYVLFTYMIATSYLKIGRFEDAEKLILKIIDYKIELTSDFPHSDKEFDKFQVGITLLLANIYIEKKDYEKLISIYKSLTTSFIDTINEMINQDNAANIFGFFVILTNHCKSMNDIPIKAIKKLSCKQFNTVNQQMSNTIAEIFNSLGIKAYNLDKEFDIDNFFNLEVDSEEAFVWNILSAFSKIEFYYRKDKEIASGLIKDLRQKIKNTIYDDKFINARIYTYEGDIFFNTNKKNEAISSYKHALINLSDDTVFLHIWINFHLALLHENDSAEKYFNRTFKLLTPKMIETEYFLQIIGEYALFLYFSKRYNCFLNLMEYFLKKYFLEHKQIFAPFAALSGHILADINSFLEKSEVKLHRGLYNNLRMELKPNEPNSIGISYYLLYNTASKYKLDKQSRKYAYYSLKNFSDKTLSSVYEKDSLFLLALSLILEKDNQVILDFIPLIFENLIKNKIGNDNADVDFLSNVFQQAKEKGVENTNFFEFINGLENFLSHSEISDKNFWLADVFYLKSNNTKKDEYDNLLEAQHYAQRGNNISALFYSVQSILITHYKRIDTIENFTKYIINYIYTCFEIYSNDSEIEQCIHNVIYIWNKSPFKAYYEMYEDINNDFYRLKSCPISIHKPMVVLFFLQRMELLKDKKYEKCIKWAFKKLGKNTN